MKPFLLVILSCAALLNGCATLPARIPYSAADLVAATAPETNPARFWADDDPLRYRAWGDTLRAQRAASGLGVPDRLLALSGGADKGAFSAGLLNGWSQRGDRPEFDIVTGVSTGALIAPFAFLGSDYDAEIKAIYIGIRAKDVYRTRVLSGLLGGASVSDTKPLRALIAAHVTQAFLDRIAGKQARGRRLLVLTTSLLRSAA